MKSDKFLDDVRLQSIYYVWLCSNRSIWYLPAKLHPGKERFLSKQILQQLANAVLRSREEEQEILLSTYGP